MTHKGKTTRDPLIPAPRERMADCIWLSRIIAKARLQRVGRLPPEYLTRFGAPDSVDEVFLSHFGITKEEIVAASGKPDDEVVAWFSGLTRAAERIREWNRIAVNLGKPGFPLESRFPIGLTTTYAHIAHLKPESIFAMLEADEGLV